MELPPFLFLNSRALNVSVSAKSDLKGLRCLGPEAVRLPRNPHCVSRASQWRCRLVQTSALVPVRVELCEEPPHEEPEEVLQTDQMEDRGHGVGLC